MAQAKLNIHDFKKMKETGDPVVFITAYDFPTAQIAERSGTDMILVGDSLGMCVYGYESTIPVTMEQCLYHCEAVRRAAPKTFLVGDMPFGSYQTGKKEAIENAIKFHKMANVDAVKLEGGKESIEFIKGITDSGMLVMGHIGLTPQSANALGGFKAQGLTAESSIELLKEAYAVYQAGAFSILIEAVPPEVTQLIQQELPIPIYSIGAGPHADGQLMISADIIGQFNAFTPKFVKKYGNVSGEVDKSFKSYVKEVKTKKFPATEHCYKMKKGELDKLKEVYRKLEKPR